MIDAFRLLCALALAIAAILPGIAEDDAGQPGVGAKPLVKDGISVSLSTHQLFPRPNAPLPVSLTLASDAATPRSGRIAITLADGHQTLFTWLSPEWTLTRAPRTIDALLPPLSIDESHGELEARLEWREGGERVPFEPISLCGQGRDERPLSVGLCVSSGIDGRALLLQSTLERFLAVPGTAAWHPDVRTVPVRLQAGELPTHALGWCAYDLVLLAGDGIARLKDKQLAALERWTRGGGSLYVVTEGPLGEDAAAFIRRLGADQAETLVDAQGKLVELGVWPRLLRPGLGRAAVAPLAVALDPAQERRFAVLPAFLWKVRAEPARLIAAGTGADFNALGKLDREARERTLATPYYNAYNVDARAKGEERPSFRNLRLPLSGSLTNLLLPSHVTIIPFSIVLLVFAAFVLAVGPGDWFLLGWLRARRFTWIVFPLVAIAFTVLMVRLSRHYLGVADHREHLEIVDCGEGGEVLRDAGIELVFSGHRGDVASDLQDSLWADLGRGESDMRYGGYRQRRDLDTVDAAPGYDGALPGHYAVTQQVGQWDPRLRRTLSFAAPPGLPFRLDKTLAIADLPAYADELVKAHGPLLVAYWRGGAMTAVRGAVDDLSEHVTERASYEGQRDWLGWLCAHPQAGWFTLASQVSPRGGGTFEDFAVHDATDPAQWLLVVAQRAGDEVWVVRRLYRDGAPSAKP